MDITPVVEALSVAVTINQRVAAAQSDEQWIPDRLTDPRLIEWVKAVKKATENDHEAPDLPEGYFLINETAYDEKDFDNERDFSFRVVHFANPAFMQLAASYENLRVLQKMLKKREEQLPMLRRSKHAAIHLVTASISMVGGSVHIETLATVKKAEDEVKALREVIPKVKAKLREEKERK
jgi:hypothetical protein